MKVKRELAETIEKLDFTEALELANETCVDSEQNYEKETTVFNFEDGSRLQLSSRDYSKKVLRRYKDGK